MAKKRDQNVPPVGIGDDGQPKVRTGFRGWIILRSNVDQCLVIAPGPFTTKHGKLKDYPARLVWPDMNDYEGACEFVTAVMDRDVEKMKFFSDQYPDYNLGITEYLKGLMNLQNAKFPGGIRLLKSVPLPRGLRLDMEIATTADKVMHIRKVIRRGTVEIAAKTIARKRVQESATA